ncbi:MAG: prepilin-type N-terminal cleavage/methylation domain-containing protein [Candidatus Magasanikbacteria bacterium]
MQKNRKGFTLIELLIVIAIIAILAAVIFVALNPLQRFRDARDSRRWSELNNLMLATQIDQIDNGGNYHSVISGLTAGSVYMIVDGATATGCDDQNAYCDTDVTADTSCANLDFLVEEGYIADVPVSPNGSGSWWSTITGYTISRSASGTLTLRACESENSDEILLLR